MTIVSPTSDNQVFILDAATDAGAKFVDIKGLLPLQRLKSTASKTNSTDLESYTSILELSVPGESTSNLQSIKVISYKDSSVTSYDVRAIDSTTSNIIAEANFSNNIPSINDLGTLSNLPANETIIEILIKRNGGSGNNKNVYLSEANVEMQ
jgi:hypothetical protein